MENVKEIAVTIVILVAATEFICRLCPKTNMVIFIRGLIIASVLVSGISSFKDFGNETGKADINYYEGNTELSEFIDDKYLQEIRGAAGDYVSSVLKAAQIEYEEIDITTDKNEDGCIEIEKIEVKTTYEQDRERALAALRNTIDEEIALEVR